ncbi:uncharacterized protein LOC144762950 [Lissotriton helveticus]
MVPEERTVGDFAVPLGRRKQKKTASEESPVGDFTVPLEREKQKKPGENVALRGRATQSSTLTGNGNLLGYMGLAFNAIDGNPDTDYMHASCSRTNDEFGPWWRVDLLRKYKVDAISITSRNEASENLNGAELLIGNSLRNHGNSNERKHRSHKPVEVNVAEVGVPLKDESSLARLKEMALHHVAEIQYLACYLSDHTPLLLTYSIGRSRPKIPLWRLNIEDLSDPTYKETISKGARKVSGGELGLN